MLLRCKRRRTTNFAFILLKFSTQGVIRRFMNIKFDELPMIVGFVLQLVRNAMHYLWFRIPESDVNFLTSWAFPTKSLNRTGSFSILHCFLHRGNILKTNNHCYNEKQKRSFLNHKKIIIFKKEMVNFKFISLACFSSIVSTGINILDTRRTNESWKWRKG